MVFKLRFSLKCSRCGYRRGERVSLSEGVSISVRIQSSCKPRDRRFPSNDICDPHRYTGHPSRSPNKHVNHWSRTILHPRDSGCRHSNDRSPPSQRGQSRQRVHSVSQTGGRQTQRQLNHHTSSHRQPWTAKPIPSFVHFLFFAHSRSGAVSSSGKTSSSRPQVLCN